MQSGAALLDSHVVTSSQDGSVLGDQARADGYPALVVSRLRLLYSRAEAGVGCRHYKLFFDFASGDTGAFSWLGRGQSQEKEIIAGILISY